MIVVSASENTLSCAWFPFTIRTLEGSVLQGPVWVWDSCIKNHFLSHRSLGEHHFSQAMCLTVPRNKHSRARDVKKTPTNTTPPTKDWLKSMSLFWSVSKWPQIFVSVVKIPFKNDFIWSIKCYQFLDALTTNLLNSWANERLACFDMNGSFVWVTIE